MSNPADIGRHGTKITPAERRALDAVWNHGGVKEAASALGLSVNTVQAQLATARSRLGEPSTLAAIRRTRENDAA